MLLAVTSALISMIAAFSLPFKRMVYNLPEQLIYIFVSGYAAGGDSALAEGKESVMLCMKKIQEKARELHLKWLENFR